MFSPMENAGTNPDLKDATNGYTLSTVESVTYLGVTVLNDTKWTTHIGEIFRKCVHLSSFCKRIFYAY